MNVLDLMRRDLTALEPYPPAPTIEEMERSLGRRIVKLDANENPYGPSRRVHTALAQCCAERYPDAEASELRRRLASYLEVDPEQIVCSVGGDEMLDLLLRLFLDPGDEVIDCTPSFSMYALSVTYNRGTLVPVPRIDGFAVDVAGVERALSDRTKVIFVCSPNNPTGNPTPEEDILRLLATGRVVVLDEAYAEFAGRTLIRLVYDHPNLVVMRTMSKWAALAGLRLGYAIMDPAVAFEMSKVKSPYNVGIAAQVAGIASIEDRDYLMANVQRIVAERERLHARLAALPYGRVYPSEANFLYWTTDGVCAEYLKEALERRGVMIRALDDPVEALRLSVGTPEESDILLRALEEAYVELSG